jgi:hypothetical protein
MILICALIGVQTAPRISGLSETSAQPNADQFPPRFLQPTLIESAMALTVAETRSAFCGQSAE